MVALVSHVHGAAGGAHCDAEWIGKGRARARAVCESTAAAASERGDDALRRYLADAVVVILLKSATYTAPNASTAWRSREARPYVAGTQVAPASRRVSRFH